jgi:hypothetical protein
MYNQEPGSITADQPRFRIQSWAMTHSVELPVDVLAEQIRSQFRQHLRVSPFYVQCPSKWDIPYLQEASTSRQEYC